MGACAQFAVFTYAEMQRTPRYEIRLAAFFADNLMNSEAHCGGFYLRDIVEEKCRLRPACRKLPGLSREKTWITPRLSETSGAQQRKNVNYRAFRNVGYNKRRDAHRGRMFRLLWTFVDLKLPSAMSHAIHKIVSKRRYQSYFQNFFFLPSLESFSLDPFSPASVAFFTAFRESPVSASNCFSSSLASGFNLSGVCTTSVT